MELDLTRVEYTQVAPVGRNTMRLLPTSKSSKTQKVVIGDDTGVVTCFGIKKNEVNPVFTVQPGEGERAVGRIALSGKDGDKLFVACGQTIKGLTKKGKEFFKFNTNLTEDVHSMVVNNTQGKIFTGGDFLYHEFLDCKDAHFAMMPDKINDVALGVCGIGAMGEENVIVACQDRCVRVIKDSEVVYQVPLDGSPTVLLRSTQEDDSCSLIYGTDNGILGQLFLGRDGGHAGWTLTNVRKLGGVNSLAAFDFTHDGSNDIVVGRDDGTVECITFDDEGPKLLFTATVNECIMSVAAGNITDPHRDEVLLVTFSGKVIGFIGRSDGEITLKEQAEAHMQGQKKIKGLRTELDSLHKDLEKKKAKYSKATRGSAPIQQVGFKIHEKFLLDEEDAMYNMSLEINTPIDFVVLQSDILLEILEVDSNTSIINRCAPSPEEGNAMLATYACIESRNRLDLKIRMTEGLQGTLTAFVTPATVPKVAQSTSFRIKPLSLHRRAHEADPANHVLSGFSVTGSFSLAEMHAWVSSVLPEMPDRCTEESLSLMFESTFINTILLCTYKQGSASFQSDNVSALSILRELISREATQKKKKLEIATDIKEESVMSCLALLHPKLEHQATLAKHFKLIEPLKEISLAEPSLEHLSPECRHVLEHAEEISRAFKLHPKNLEYLHGVVTNLYMDYAKFQGRDAKAEAAALQSLLDCYDWESLMAFFGRR